MALQSDDGTKVHPADEVGALLVAMGVDASPSTIPTTPGSPDLRMITFDLIGGARVVWALRDGVWVFTLVPGPDAQTSRPMIGRTDMSVASPPEEVASLMMELHRSPSEIPEPVEEEEG